MTNATHCLVVEKTEEMKRKWKQNLTPLLFCCFKNFQNVDKIKRITVHKLEAVKENKSKQRVWKTQIPTSNLLFVSSNFPNKTRFYAKPKLHFGRNEKKSELQSFWYLHLPWAVEHRTWTQKSKRYPETTREEETKIPWILSAAILDWLVHSIVSWMRWEVGVEWVRKWGLWQREAGPQQLIVSTCLCLFIYFLFFSIKLLLYKS